jgi:hypothetical protein
MAALQHGLRHRASVLLLAALLLVPIALSGHNHVSEGTRPCSICAVTHHAPAVSAPAAPQFASRFTVLLPAMRTTLAPSRTDQAPRAGRAPPADLVTVVA